MGIIYFLLLSCLGLAIAAPRRNCGSAGEVENGHIDYPEGTEFGDKIVITCHPGYQFIGKQEPREIVCGDQGWMSRLPVCDAVTCNPPPMITNGTFSPNEETYSYGKVVQYSCQNGFTLNGTKSVSCSDDGTFQPAPPTCVAVTCNPLPPIVGGTFSPDKETYSYGDVVKYSCQNDLTLSGSSSISCSDDGIFQPAPPTCISSRPPFGYKAIATFKCRSGHIMKGEATQTCEMNSQWSPGLPTCEMVTCEPPPTVADGTFSPNKDKYVYGEVVQYSCDKEFVLSGSSISCSDDGTFQPAPPTCVMVQCKDPEVENADWV
ncbi:C4b-binding protein [Chaetodon trifascialis]|uniref:C4b-binding protein n=1 Tax=Chaetodon trifascialis TaxID=109706 RepID=UPI00399416FF